MNDTILLITLIVASVQLLVALLIYRAVRSGGGAGVRGGSAVEIEGARLLAARARALFTKVDSLPHTLLGPGGDKRLRDANLWTAVDVTELRPRSAFLLGLSEEPLAAAESAMQWLQGQAEKIRSASKDQGFHYVDFPHDKWTAMHAQALDGLHLLETYGEVAAQTIETLSRR